MTQKIVKRTLKNMTEKRKLMTVLEKISINKNNKQVTRRRSAL